MKYSKNSLIDFIRDLSGEENVVSESDIFNDIGMSGDDFHEMIEKYTTKYSVDMSGYLWYFHTDEEGQSFLGEFFFAPPYKRVKRIPVTPGMLTEFANKGKWEIQYPEHQIPKRRYDLIIDAIVTGLILGGLLIWFLLS